MRDGPIPLRGIRQSVGPLQIGCCVHARDREARVRHVASDAGAVSGGLQVSLICCFCNNRQKKKGTCTGEIFFINQFNNLLVSNNLFYIVN